MKIRTILTVALAAVGASAEAAALIEEKLTLTKGWNAVYLESTPTNDSVAAFFGPLAAVQSVGAYQSDSYDVTPLIDSEGKEVRQKPLSYHIWSRRATDGGINTLGVLCGGTCYLIYATEACSTNFVGTPCPPNFSWRTASTSDGLANLVAPSLPVDVQTQTLNAYFKEGPAGSSAGAWQVVGTGTSPTLMPLGLFGKAYVRPGSAYVLTATRDAVWPGVIDVSSAPGGVCFTSNGTDRVAFWLTNAGTTEHSFTVTYDAGFGGGPLPVVQFQNDSGWVKLEGPCSLGTYKLQAGQQRAMMFALDRTAFNENAGGLLTITDDATRMRVRLPLKVEKRIYDPSVKTSAPWPCGFWIGTLDLTRVNCGTNAKPEAAGGSVSSTLLMNWADQDTLNLLQRVSYGTDKNGVTRFFRTLEDAKKTLDPSQSVRRVSCVLLDPKQQVVKGSLNGKTASFKWVVSPRASTNPMRHSWHPDHDGYTYQSDGTRIDAPDGDNLANYTASIKPELFSISNKVEFTFNSQAYVPDGELRGDVTWKLGGLKSTGEVVCTGEFTLRRVSDNPVLE